jgi:hypothetical protein
MFLFGGRATATQGKVTNLFIQLMKFILVTSPSRFPIAIGTAEAVTFFAVVCFLRRSRGLRRLA